MVSESKQTGVQSTEGRSTLGVGGQSPPQAANMHKTGDGVTSEAILAPNREGITENVEHMLVTDQNNSQPVRQDSAENYKKDEPKSLDSRDNQIQSNPSINKQQTSTHSLRPPPPPLDLPKIGTPEDLAYAEAICPDQIVYACVPVQRIGYQRRCRVYLTKGVFTCGGYLIANALPFYDGTEVSRHTRYIVTDHAVIINVEDYDSPILCCYASGHETREIPYESIVQVNSDTLGDGCKCCARPCIDVVTAGDEFTINKTGITRNPNNLYVDDVKPLADLIRKLKRRYTKRVAAETEGETRTAGHSRRRQIGRRVFVATEQAPEAYRIVVLDEEETMESLGVKIGGALAVMYVNKMQLVADGVRVEVDDVDGIRCGDRLVVS